MPATEETKYNQKTMHVVFAVSSVVMLIATIWMLAADHIREWKRYQLDFRDANRWTDEARLTEMQILTDEELKQALKRLDKAAHQPIDASAMDRFLRLIEAEDARLKDETGQEVAAADVEQIRSLRQAIDDSLIEDRDSADVPAARADFIGALGSVIAEARRREDELAMAKKFETAKHTSKVSKLGIAVDESAPKPFVDNLQAEIDTWQEKINDLEIQLGAATDYRIDLGNVVKKEMRSDELAAMKQVDALQGELDRLHEKAEVSFWTQIGDPLARAPILDAFNNTDIGIEQIWLPDMLIDYNFSNVARYDRCTSCHRAIDQTAPGSAVDPLYPTIPPDDRIITTWLSTPDEPPTGFDEEIEAEEAADPINRESGSENRSGDPASLLQSTYGLVLAPYGQITEDKVTIQVVLPGTSAAEAGLATGDVIVSIAGSKVEVISDVAHFLLDSVAADAWGEPIEMAVRRGLDHPFTSHPRLDLFVGSMSPHVKGEMGCTICHDGQGSATAFKWASHTPNDPKQAGAWHDQHGWFDNHHWIFPMTPRRFIESNCLKCHHDVIELEPSDRFPDPPAPKLVRGWKLVQEFGCFGCHEISGYDGPETRIGPDLRPEPNFFAAAQQILRDDGLSEPEQEWARAVAKRPEIALARHRLMESLLEDALVASGTGEGDEEDAESDGKARLSPATHALSELLQDIEAAGELRKPGPSLRFLGHKVEYRWLISWIREPKNFRPTTTMPQFFGQADEYDYLDNDEKVFAIQGLADEPELVTDVEYTRRMEDVEIRAIAEYLLKGSDDFEYLPKTDGVEQASADRGKKLFQTRGCLACHSHAEFPGIKSTQGPELSRLGPKLDWDLGRDWLYSWLKDPSRYHVRTVMPNLFLDPIEVKDAAGKPTGKTTDPAADIARFLLSTGGDWKPKESSDRGQFTDSERRDLEELSLEWLRSSFSRRKAKRYLHEGIPESMADRIKVDEMLLIGMTDENRDDRLLEYVGRRSIGKYGCFGCHDIPGFEGAKPIGTGLADWGRKEPSKLAFEQIGRFLSTHGVDGKHGTDDDPHGHGGRHGLDPDDYDADTGYFLQALNSHGRHGFIWQKLRMPRSYDFAKTRNKGYNERLRMPHFPLDDAQREAIITFILGLTNEPPAEKYIYHPTGREQAIHAGKDVLRKYNCAGCHFLEMEKWRFDFVPGQFEEPPEAEDYPFLVPHFTEQEVADSLKPDRRGLLRAYLHGMPVISQETGRPTVVDDAIDVIEEEDLEDPEIDHYYHFTLWKNEIIEGMPHALAQNVLVPAQRGTYGPARGVAYPGNGGDLAKYLFPHVIAAEKAVNPQVPGGEAWGWLPPPLIGEGKKVQTDWLHDFLLDPHPIRPAVVMRMPKFNMSSAEASRLANYFAAVAGSDFPYEYDERRRDGYLASVEEDHPAHFDDAMKIVVDQNYCIKCHAVGDFEPQGAVTTLGPPLDQVYRRLRPDFVRRWVGNPKRMLPYTGMPVNIPFKNEDPHFGGVAQTLYPGTSEEQLDAVVDLLMNFDVYSQRQTEINALVKSAMPAPGEAATEGEAEKTEDATGEEGN